MTVLAMRAKLVVVGGNATRGEVPLKLPMTIGRTKEASLTIAHPMVSRLHCTLYELHGCIVIRDNNSSNGTFVNDQQIKECVLKPGDKLTVGPLTFVAIYRHSGPFPELGNRGTTGQSAPAPAPAAASPAQRPSASDTNLTEFARAAGLLGNNNNNYHSPSDNAFADLMGDPDQIENFARRPQGFETDQQTQFFDLDDDADGPSIWDALSNEDANDDDEDISLDESQDGGSTDASDSDGTDLNAFFKDLVDMAGEESMLNDDDDGLDLEHPER